MATIQNATTSTLKAKQLRERAKGGKTGIGKCLIKLNALRQGDGTRKGTGSVGCENARRESSTTTASAGFTPSSLITSRYTSGAGLVAGHCSPLSTASN